MTSDYDSLVAQAQSDLQWNTPLSEEHAAKLLNQLRLTDASRIVDFGCGAGELTLRALAISTKLKAVGIDNNPINIERAKESSKLKCVNDRVNFRCENASNSTEIADRTICIGASHIWGNPKKALTSLLKHTNRSGMLLYGEGFWEKLPRPEIQEIFGEVPSSLNELVDLAVECGWRPLALDVANQEEWDTFEFSWLRGLEKFAMASSDKRDSISARKLADERRKEYLNGYRGYLGFAYLTLINSND